MAVSRALAYQHVLCMDLKQDQFSFAVINKSTKEIVDYHSYELTDYSRPGIEKIISDELFGYDYADFVLTAGTVRNTLVPTSIFNFSKASEIFQLNYSEPVENLDYNRIAELDIVNIYEIPLWIKAAFVIRFPRVKIVHRTTVLLKGVFNQPSYNPKLHLFIEKDSFYFFITAKSKLHYYNRFYYKDIADIVYHVLFVLEQKEMSPEKAELHLYGVSPQWASLERFSSFFKNPPKVSALPGNAEHFILAKQLLCV
jgi:hypothetical protein